jgi:hypothetical protein
MDKIIHIILQLGQIFRICVLSVLLTNFAYICDCKDL